MRASRAYATRPSGLPPFASMRDVETGDRTSLKSAVMLGARSEHYAGRFAHCGGRSEHLNSAASRTERAVYAVK